MLSTSFIVARQPAGTPRKEGFSRNSVNTATLGTYEQNTVQDWLDRGRDTQEDDYEIQTEPSLPIIKGNSIKKIGRSLSMSKRGDTIRTPGGKVQAKSGRSVSQTRDPQLSRNQAAWDRTHEYRETESFRNLSIKEDGEGATKFGYNYTPSLYGTLSGDARSIYAIQSRPLPRPGEGKKNDEKSLYENINRFTSAHRASQDLSRAYAKNSRIPVYRRAATQAQISRTYEDPARLALSSPGQEESVVRKGLMWIQQDKLFSRWKERFIILTTGYLQIFKKGATRFSDMGTFIRKVEHPAAANRLQRRIVGEAVWCGIYCSGGQERIPHPGAGHLLPTGGEALAQKD